MWTWQNCQTGEIAKCTWEKGEVNVAKYPSKGYSIAEPFHNENFVFLFTFSFGAWRTCWCGQKWSPHSPKKKRKRKAKQKTKEEKKK
jgi:hypothetical protein